MEVADVVYGVMGADSTEALLAGKNKHIRMLVRAINHDGSPATHIRFAVSEGFVVRSPSIVHCTEATLGMLCIKVGMPSRRPSDRQAKRAGQMAGQMGNG